MTEAVLSQETNTVPAIVAGETPKDTGVTSWFGVEAPESEAGKTEADTPPASAEAAKDDGGASGEGESHEDGSPSAEGETSFDKDKDDVPYKALEKRIDRYTRRLNERDVRIAELEAKLNGANVAQPQMPLVEPTLEMFEGDQTKFKNAYAVFARSLAEQEVKFKTTVDSYKSREAAFKAVTPGYDEAMQDLFEDYKHVNAPEINSYLVESDVGPQVYHYLATNRAEIDRILALPPHRRLAELGKLEVKVGAPKGAPKVPPKQSKAPAPLTPEKGSAPKIVSLSDPNLPQSEYRELRMKNRKRNM